MFKTKKEKFPRIFWAQMLSYLKKSLFKDYQTLRIKPKINRSELKCIFQ